MEITSDNLAVQLIKKKVGRPSKLTNDHLKKIAQYYENHQPYYESPVEYVNKKGIKKTIMERLPNPPPSLLELAEYLGVTRYSVYHWNERNSKFRDIVRTYRNKINEEYIVNNALIGKYNANFARFLLINKHGYREKIEIDSSNSANTKPVQFNTQINYFLDQQGVKPLNLKDNKDDMPALPAFQDSEKEL